MSDKLSRKRGRLAGKSLPLAPQTPAPEQLEAMAESLEYTVQRQSRQIDDLSRQVHNAREDVERIRKAQAAQVAELSRQLELANTKVKAYEFVLTAVGGGQAAKPSTLPAFQPWLASLRGY